MPDNSVTIRITGKYQDEITAGINRSIAGLSAAIDVVQRLGGYAIRGGEALWGLLDTAAQTGDAFDEMAQRTGAGVEFLSSMGYVAGQAGADLGTLEMGLRNISRVAADSAAGSDRASAALASIGVNALDLNGNLKTSEQLFWEATAGIKALSSETAQAAITQEVFGRGGTQLLPIIKEDTNALRDQIAEAYRLGIVYSDEAAARSAEFCDAEDRLKASLTGVKNEIALELMPAVADMLNVTATSLAAHRDQVHGYAQDILIIGRYMSVFGNLAQTVWDVLATGVHGLRADLDWIIAKTTGAISAVSGFLGMEGTAQLTGIAAENFQYGYEQEITARKASDEAMKRQWAEMLKSIDQLDRPLEETASVLAQTVPTVSSFERSLALANTSLDSLALSAPQTEESFSDISDEGYDLADSFYEAQQSAGQLSVAFVDGASAISAVAASITSAARGLEGITATYTAGMTIPYAGHIMYPPVRPRPFQEGGIVTRPTLALLGESGPEAVTPLGRGPTTIIVNQHFNGFADRTTMERAVREIAPEIERQSAAGLNKIKTR